MVKIDFVDPKVFDPSSIDPETAKFNKGLERLMARVPPFHTRTIQELREEAESGKGWMGPFRRLAAAKDRVVFAGGGQRGVPACARRGVCAHACLPL
jgi:hypothetical protein